MCIFDQQHMLEWVASQSTELLRPCPPLPYSLLSAWHGALGPIHLLRRLGLLNLAAGVLQDLKELKDIKNLKDI